MMKSLATKFTYSYFKNTALILLLFSSQLFAAYEIKKFTINSGGSETASQRFQLNGSVAQVDANTTLSSNSFQLSPGFWQKLHEIDIIFINSFE